MRLYMDGFLIAMRKQDYDNKTNLLPLVKPAAFPEGPNVKDIEFLPRVLTEDEILKRGAAAVASRPSGKPFVWGTVDPTADDRFLPGMEVPAEAVSKPLAVTLAKGEYEPGSVLVRCGRELKGLVPEIGELRCGKAVLPKDAVDVRVVKTVPTAAIYPSVRGSRILKPMMLLHDDSLLRVDLATRRAELKLRTADGCRYVPCSDDPGDAYVKRMVEEHKWLNVRCDAAAWPIYDAKTIQPFALEKGRCKQFFATFRIDKDAKPGLYRGTLELVGAVKVPLALQVLPIDLPEQGSPKHNLAKSYISLNNSFPSPMGATLERRREIALKTMKEIRAHRLMHTECLWETPVHAELARKAGFSEPDRIFTDFTGSIPDWRTLYPKDRLASLTLADKAEAEKVILRGLEPALAHRRETFRTRPEDFILFYSETKGYCRLVKAQEGQAEIARKAGFTVFSHIMEDDVNRIGADVMDMTATTTVEKKYAEQWNATGGELINYANPFPSGENPEFYRRRVGVLMYKSDFSGDMLHECFRRLWPFHEWNTDGETGTYRNFEMCYPTHDGFIWKLAYDGMREAMNDVRYFTALKQRAVKWQYAKDEALRREAKRQLLWLELLDEHTVDLDMLRAAVADRIMILDRLSKGMRDEG